MAGLVFGDGEVTCHHFETAGMPSVSPGSGFEWQILTRKRKRDVLLVTERKWAARDVVLLCDECGCKDESDAPGFLCRSH